MAAVTKAPSVEVRAANVDEVMIVGHAPHLDVVIAHALAPELGDPRRITSLKKAGCAGLDLPDEDQAEDVAVLRYVVDPNTLRLLSRLTRKKG